MSIIYSPKGKAGEYSPLAVNIYSGCNHGCFYCYVPKILGVYNSNYKHTELLEKNGFIEKLHKEAKNYKLEKKQVLLSFTTDPYNALNDKLDLTRETIKILCENDFPVAVLTKSGDKPLKDLDLFIKYKDRIKIGASLTLLENKSIDKFEKGAAYYEKRENLLKVCNENGVKTWASIEPVIIPSESLDILKRTVKFVDQYKIGKLNHYPNIENKIDWSSFLYSAYNIMKSNNKMFMIKEDLAKYDTKKILTDIDLSSSKMFININKQIFTLF